MPTPYKDLTYYHLDKGAPVSFRNKNTGKIEKAVVHKVRLLDTLVKFSTGQIIPVPNFMINYGDEV
ncbi:hypothetical protein JZU46_06600 [bacterium]|nr:hypothetical protein [bacterium]